MIETDIVIVGSGAAGLTAAITARVLGLEVLVIEKTDLFGGTTAYSGGAPWIPCNHVMRQIGLTDTRQAAQTYLRAVLGEHYNDDLVETYLDNAAPMLKFLEMRRLDAARRRPCHDLRLHRGAADGQGRARRRTIAPARGRARMRDSIH